MAVNFFLIYFGILLVILVACAFVGKNPKNNNNILLFAVFLIFCFMAFRKDFTPDYGAAGYEGFFESVHNNDFSDIANTEIGYQWLNIILPSYRMVIIVTSLLFCSALFFLFSRYILPKYWAFAFPIIFISRSMLMGNTSGIRNSIAVAAFIFGFYFLEKNKKKLYLIILVLASFFHTSSLFFIPLVFMNSDKLPYYKIRLFWIIIILFSVLTTFFPNIIYLFSIRLLSSLSSLSRYNFYLQDKVTYGFRGLSFLLIFFMLYMNINALKSNKLFPNEILLVKLSLLFYIIMLLPGIGLLSRMYFYLSFPQMAGNLYVMRRIDNNALRLAYYLGIIIIPLMEFYSYTQTDNFKDFYLQYHSILF